MIRIIMVIMVAAAPLWGMLDDFQRAYVKSFALEKRGNYIYSLKVLKKIYPKYQYSYELNLRMGWLYYLNEQHQQSIKMIKKAIKLKPDGIEGKNIILLPLTALKQWKEVSQYAEEIITISPVNYYAHIRLGYALYLQKKYDEALKHYLLLHKSFPGDVDVKLGIATCYHKKGKTKLARRFYREILNVSPYHQMARDQLSTLKK